MDTIEYRAVTNDPRYRVGSDGSVWSLCNNKWGLRNEWKQMALISVPSPQCKDYVRFVVTIGQGRGTRVRRYVHHLVLEAFVGARPDGHEACHRNGVPTDNRVENLYWGTRVENDADRRTHGRNRGVNHKAAKLNDDLVRQIRARAASGEKHGSIASSLGIGRRHISRVASGERWGHVQ